MEQKPHTELEHMGTAARQVCPHFYRGLYSQLLWSGQRHVSHVSRGTADEQWDATIVMLLYVQVQDRLVTLHTCSCHVGTR